MNEEQLNKIIELLEELIDNTRSLNTAYNLRDVCSRLDDVEKAIKSLKD